MIQSLMATGAHRKMAVIKNGQLLKNLQGRYCDLLLFKIIANQTDGVTPI